MTPQQLIRALLDSGILEEGNIKLKSGIETTRYYNIKKAYGNPIILTELADHLKQQFYKATTCVAAGIGGIPLATAISIRHRLNLTIIREEQKDHGLHNYIELHRPLPEDLIAIVDDVYTTGKSINTIVDILQKNTNATILGAYVILNRGPENANVHSLYTPDDF